VTALSPENEKLLDDLELFIVAPEDNLPHFDRAPFGIELRPENHFDPLRMGSHAFLELLKRLDEVTFGPEGMPMPRWVFFVGSELPAGIVGFGRPAKKLTDAGRTLLNVPKAYDQLVPYSMFIAVPMSDEGTWMGHNLASVAGLLPDERLGGLGSLTKAVALAAYRTKFQVGATQWDTHALNVHTRLGPLELLTAWTPAHGEPWTLTYRAVIDENSLRSLARDPRGVISRPKPTLWIDSKDHESMRALQRRIEAGERFVVVDRPQPIEHGRQRVPIAKIG
jgi:hypothetical protein